MVFSSILRCVSMIVGAVFPVFYTFKSLVTEQRDKEIYWLKYWAVFGASLAVEFVLESFLFTYIIELARLIFIIYSLHPSTNGAQFIYDELLKPLLQSNDSVAPMMDRMSEDALKLFSAVVDRMPDMARVKQLLSGAFAFGHLLAQKTPTDLARSDKAEEMTTLIVRENEETLSNEEDHEKTNEKVGTSDGIVSVLKNAIREAKENSANLTTLYESDLERVEKAVRRRKINEATPHIQIVEKVVLGGEEKSEVEKDEAMSDSNIGTGDNTAAASATDMEISLERTED